MERRLFRLQLESYCKHQQQRQQQFLNNIDHVCVSTDAMLFRDYSVSIDIKIRTLKYDILISPLKYDISIYNFQCYLF